MVCFSFIGYAVTGIVDPDDSFRLVPGHTGRNHPIQSIGGRYFNGPYDWFPGRSLRGNRMVWICNTAFIEEIPGHQLWFDGGDPVGIVAFYFVLGKRQFQ